MLGATPVPHKPLWFPFSFLPVFYVGKIYCDCLLPAAVSLSPTWFKILQSPQLQAGMSQYEPSSFWSASWTNEAKPKHNMVVQRKESHPVKKPLKMCDINLPSNLASTDLKSSWQESFPSLHNSPKDVRMGWRLSKQRSSMQGPSITCFRYLNAVKIHIFQCGMGSAPTATSEFLGKAIAFLI